MRNGEDRKGKFIAVANMKGGVGKTTTVVSLAEALAADDETKKILVIDLDPQASASVAIAGDDKLNELIDENRTFECFLDKRLVEKVKISVQDMVHPTICGTYHRNRQLDVALLPCGPRLRSVERQLLYELAKSNFAFSASDGQIAKLFKSDIMPLAKSYDYILVDCAPGISPVTEIAIRLCDLIIVPTVPDRISVYGLNAFYETIWNTSSRTLPQPKATPRVLIVRMNRGMKEHQMVFDGLSKRAKLPDAGYSIFEVQVPTSAALVDALMKPAFLTFTQKYTPSVVSGILSPLVEELKGKL